MPLYEFSLHLRFTLIEVIHVKLIFIFWFVKIWFILLELYSFFYLIIIMSSLNEVNFLWCLYSYVCVIWVAEIYEQQFNIKF